MINSPAIKLASFVKIQFRIINYLILVFLLLLSLKYWDDSNFISNWSIVLTSASLMLFAYQMIVFRTLKLSIIDYKVIFIIFSHIFLFGQIYLIAFGQADRLFYDVISRYPPTLIFKSGLFSLCYIQAIFIGFMYFPKKTMQFKWLLKNVDEIKLKNLMFEAGSILLLLSTPFRIYMDLINVSLAQSASSYREVVSLSGVATISFLFIPSVILIVCSKKFTKRVNIYFMLAVIFYFVAIMIMTGDRRYYFTAILAIMLTFIKLYHPKIHLKDILKLTIVMVVLLNILAIIRTIRLTSLTTVNDFFVLYWKEILTTNPIFESLNEFGVTILSVAFPIKLIPSVIPYLEGFSFYGALPSLLPIGWMLGDFFAKASIPKLLNPIEGYPVGGSLPGDLYANFGWWGLIGAFIVGRIISKLFVVNGGTYSTFSIAIYYSAFYVLINLVRATFVEVFRTTFIVIVIPVLVMYFLKQFNKVRNPNSSTSLM